MQGGLKQEVEIVEHKVEAADEDGELDNIGCGLLDVTFVEGDGSGGRELWNEFDESGEYGLFLTVVVSKQSEIHNDP